MDCKSFGRIGSEGMHYLRILIATGMQDLKTILERMAQAINYDASFADFIEAKEYFSWV